MKPTVNIAEERKKRQRSRRMRGIALVFGVLLLLLIGFYIADVLIQKRATSRITDWLHSSGGSGFPASIPYGKIKNITHVGKNIVVLKESNLYIYNNKGKQIANIQQMKHRSVMQGGYDLVLYYDIGGKDWALHSMSSVIRQGTTKDSIVAADLGTNGEIAIATWPANFVSEVTVLSSKGEPIYRHSFSENLISALSLSPKTNHLVLVSLESNNGALQSTLLFYSLQALAETVGVPIKNELVIWVDYYREDTVLVLTDRSYRIYGADGSLQHIYEFPQYFEMLDFRILEGKVAIVGRNTETREYQLLLLSDTAQETARLDLEYRPLDITLGNKAVCLLFAKQVEEYNLHMVLQHTYEATDVVRIYLRGEKLYLFTENEIRLQEREET